MLGFPLDHPGSSQNPVQGSARNPTCRSEPSHFPASPPAKLRSRRICSASSPFCRRLLLVFLVVRPDAWEARGSDELDG
ncbi:hypothetical protein SLEP1_g26135 [Rubroshorea leprosula]|uniref:Uncharacterized protein n=1 Tax=Rubroshorea leprosula TaxID=152421 RepID=A0AAV5JVG0_9ROSI|nr:hypothetical protein SLEP1_g26135 [Rubroshorea leprosula]